MTDTLDHLRPGLSLPSVNLPATEGIEICLATLPGRSLLVVYPWTGRPGEPNPPNWDETSRRAWLDTGARGLPRSCLGFHRTWHRALRVEHADNGLSARDGAAPQAAVPGLERFGVGPRARAPPAEFCRWQRELSKAAYFTVEAGHIAHVFHHVPDPALHADDVLSWLRGKSYSRSSSASSTE